MNLDLPCGTAASNLLLAAAGTGALLIVASLAALRRLDVTPQEVDPRDGTIAVWLVPEKGTTLQEGLTGRVVVTLPGVVGAAVVPARAVVLTDGKTFVVVRRDGKAVKTEVDVVASSGAEALVIGIAADEEVAADAGLAEVAP